MSITNADLYEHFGIYGDLRHAYVICHPTTGVSRGFGYVHYQKKESVDQALEAENSNSNKSFKCERYSLNVKRDQDKKRKTKSSDEDFDTSNYCPKKFENPQYPQQNLQGNVHQPENYRMLANNNQNNSMASLGYQNQQGNSMNHPNYAFPGANVNQVDYQIYHQQNQIHCNNQPFYPTDPAYTNAYGQNAQFCQQQQQNYESWQPGWEQDFNQSLNQNFVNLQHLPETNDGKSEFGKFEQQRMEQWLAYCNQDGQFTSNDSMNQYNAYGAGSVLNQNSNGGLWVASEENMVSVNAYPQSTNMYYNNYYNSNAENFDKNENEFYHQDNYQEKPLYSESHGNHNLNGFQGSQNLPESQISHQKTLAEFDHQGETFNLNSFNRKSAEDASSSNSNDAKQFENADRENLNKTLNSLRLFTNKVEYIQG